MHHQALKRVHWKVTICALACFAALSGTATADPAQIFPSGANLSASSDGGVYYFKISIRKSQILRARFGERPKVVAIKGFESEATYPLTITEGGDHRTWASARNTTTHRTTIYRISKGKLRGKVVLPRGHYATAMASDSAGRTWLLGRKDGRVDYLTPSLKLRSVRVPGASSLDAITRGPDGHVWAAGPNVVKQISTNGVMRSVSASSTASAEIRSAGGSLWVTGMGGVQQISVSGAKFFPLQYLQADGSSGNSHATYVSRNRFSASLFTRPDGSLGFTAGAMAVATEDDYFVDDWSVGRVDPVAGAIENRQFGQSVPGYAGSALMPLTDFFGADGRLAGTSMSTVDKYGNLWLGQLDQVVAFQAGSW